MIDPDTYLVELFDDLPIEVTETVVRLASEKTRPPQMSRDILAALRNAGLGKFPELVECYL
ncbi:MAG: hypothetical protein ACRD0K_26385 [Egibacteraceae bacterium]